MTPKQRNHLFIDLWPKACQAQGWNPSDREKRLAVLSKILGRDIESAGEINNREDYDAVKRELGYLADNLTATIETLNPVEGRARRLRETIRDQVKCLRLYHPNPDGYLQTIVYDKFSKLGWGASIDELSATPGERGPSQLEQIVMAMARGIQFRRKAAGDTIHAMKLRAGVLCDCSLCHRKPQPPFVTQVENEESVALAGVTDTSEGDPF